MDQNTLVQKISSTKLLDFKQFRSIPILNFAYDNHAKYLDQFVQYAIKPNKNNRILIKFPLDFGSKMKKKKGGGASFILQNKYTTSKVEK